MVERNSGEVDYFNEVGSYGFITSDDDGAPDKDVFFDMDDVGGPDLEEGEQITFEYKMAERGPRATTVYRDGDPAGGDESADDDQGDEDSGDSTDTAVYTGDQGDAEVRLSEADYEELRAQMIDAFEGADYPVTNPMELVPTLPDGSDTLFEAGDFSMTVIELTTPLDADNYPYGGVESFVDSVFDQLEAANEIRLPDGVTAERSAEETSTADEADDATNVYGGRETTGSAADGGVADSDPEDGWEPIYRYCSACGTDLRKYGRITSGNFCPACGTLIGE